jgi:hypothetical protein
VTEVSGKVQRIGNGQICEIIDYPDLDSFDLVEKGDLTRLKEIATAYLQLINRYPQASQPLTSWIERLRTLHQLASSGNVRIGGRWMTRESYNAAMEKRREAAAAAAKEAERKEMERSLAVEAARQAELRRIAAVKRQEEEAARRKAEEQIAYRKAAERAKTQKANLAALSGNLGEHAVKNSFSAERLIDRVPGLPTLDALALAAAFNPRVHAEIAQSGYVVAKVFTDQGADDFAVLACEDENRHQLTSLRFEVVLKGESLDRFSPHLKRMESALGTFDSVASGWLSTGIASALTILNASIGPIHPAISPVPTTAVPSASSATHAVALAKIEKKLSNRFYTLVLTAPVHHPDGTVTRNLTLDVRASAHP